MILSNMCVYLVHVLSFVCVCQYVSWTVCVPVGVCRSDGVGW